MVFSYQPRDIGGDIGRIAGQVGGNLLQQKLQANALSGMDEQIAGMQDRSPISLYAALQDKLKWVPGGEKYARQMLPTLIESAKMIPFTGQQGQEQPQQPMPEQSMQQQGQPTGEQTQAQLGGLGQAIMRSTRAQPQQQAQPQQGLQTQGMQQDVSQAAGGQLPQAEQLAQEPERTQAVDLEGLKAAYSAAPVFSLQDHQGRVQEIMRTQQKPYTEAVEQARSEWEDRELRPFEQRRELNKREEARVVDAKAQFEPLFTSRFKGATPEDRFIADKILESYATGSDEKGRPYTPRIAAQKAIDEYNQINKGLNQARAEKPLTYTEAAFNSSLQERIRRLKPIADRARKYGFEKQLRDRMIADDVLTPAMASSLLWKPDQELIKKVEKVPKLKKYQKGETPMSFSKSERDRMALNNKQAIEMTADLITDSSANDSLVVLRDMLADRGLDQRDFAQAMDLAQERGWNKQRLHEDEDQYLARPIRYSLGDLWMGRVPSFKGFLRNFVFGEK